MSVHSRTRPDHPRHVGTHLGALAGHAHPGHGVDEAAGAVADARHALGRAGRCDEQHRVDAGGVRLHRPRSELLDGQVGHDGPGHPRCGQGSRHALVPGPEDDVVVGHDDDRCPDLGLRDSVEDLPGNRSSRRGPARTPPGSPGRRSSGPRRGCRPPPRRPRRPRPLPACPPSRRSCRPSGRAPGACDPIRAGTGALSPTQPPRPVPRISRTWATSLSPRPERVTSTVEAAGSASVPAARATQASACADSSAGMMPSV